MAINLEKGQKINLEKADGSSLQQIFLGVGWDVAKSKGLFGFGGGSGDIDLDASVILFDENKQVVDVVYFGQLRSKDGDYRDWETDRKSTRLNSSHITRSRMPSSA